MFLFLALLPLLGLGVLEYGRSHRALEAMIADQNGRVAERVAEVVRARAELMRSDLLLLAENEETQRWFAGRGAGREDPTALAEADRFVRDAWRRMEASYAGMTYVDAAGRVVYRLGEMFEPGDLRATASAGILRPVRAAIPASAGSAPGAALLYPALRAMLPTDLLAGGFGETGFGMVLDRERAVVLYHPSWNRTDLPLDSLRSGEGWTLDAGSLEQPRGQFTHRSGDTVRIASFVSLAFPRWTIVVSGAMNEFEEPFTALGRRTLFLFGAVGLLATLVFSLLLRRTTRSLEELTRATAVVGRGDFAPSLPPAGGDEVGRLTRSFDTMVRTIRDMVGQVAASRQMAVLGEFAAHLSHEIRNPLTSIKLNLQKLERDERAGRLPDTAGPPLNIALREVARLDRVVGGVLDLTRSRPRDLSRFSLNQLVLEVLVVVAEQARVQGVSVDTRLAASPDLVEADRAELKGALLNLLLNALQSMDGPGRLEVGSERDAARLRVRIRDTGPGVAAAERGDIFRPFFTTREGGTGLGLPLAKRAIEDSGGRLTLAPDRTGGGAEFIVEIPLEVS